MILEKKLKVLWLSNYRFTNDSIKTTGTWLKVMGESLSACENVELINITFGVKRSFSFEVVNGIHQYLLPSTTDSVSELPDNATVSEIERIIEEVQADIIHVWGTESVWGLITSKYVEHQKVLLEMQGVLCQIRQQFFGGLSFFQILKCTGPKELLKFKTHLLCQYRTYVKKAKRESDIIKAHRFISIQSNWTEGVIRSITTSAITFSSLIPLRAEFTNARNTWRGQAPIRIFTSAANLHAFKGLHVAIEAVAVLRHNGIDASLYVAGAYSSGIRKSGYQRYLEGLIKHHKLDGHIYWLGALDAEELVHELQIASVVVIPSYVESYCVSLYEALCIGTPVVCSFAGAMPEGTIFTSDVKYFQPGDYVTAAFLLQKVLDVSERKETTENNAISTNEAVKRQLDIYSQILNI